MFLPPAAESKETSAAVVTVKLTLLIPTGCIILVTLPR